MTRPARLRWTLVMVALVGVVAIVAMALGPARLSPGSVALELLDLIPGLHVDSGLDPRQAAIVTEWRLPRVLLTLIVGAVLAVSGGAYQGVFHNDLADPYLLGVAAGAGLGVTIAVTMAEAPQGAVPLAAFLGALGATMLTYSLGARHPAGDRATLLLAGIVVAALASAVQTFLLQRHDEAIRDVYAWLLGRFNTTTWSDVRLLAPYALVAIVGLLLLAPRIDVMVVGDTEAAALGIDPVRTRLIAIVLASLGTAAAVAVSGLIGFVGVIVPHAVRLISGPRYQRLLPMSVAVGAAFMCAADLAARTVLSPAEIPVGVVTAIIGAPVFMLAMRTTRRQVGV